MKGRIRTIHLLAALVLLALAHPSYGADQSVQEREKADVRAIFRLLLATTKPGDGWTFDLPCVYPLAWDVTPLSTPAAKQPKALLSYRDALDPKQEQSEKFCDFGERSKLAQALAEQRIQRSECPSGKYCVRTADLTFSYPIFYKGRTRAKVQYHMQSAGWDAKGRVYFVGGGGSIFLEKRDKFWTLRLSKPEYTVN